MSSSSFTSVIMGGLGNQLFQFALGLELAKRNQAGLTLDLSWYGRRLRRNSKVTLREFELDIISSGIPWTGLELGAVQELRSHVKDATLRRIPNTITAALSKTYVEKTMRFDPRVLELKPGRRLLGYFIARAYFPSVEMEIKQRIISSCPRTQNFNALIDEIQANKPVILHVRRGDHLTVPGPTVGITQDYYLEAVRELRKRNHDGPIWVMSDSPSDAANWLRDFVKVDFFVPQSLALSSLQSLCLMSSGESIVTTSSTFSWWAAFVSESNKSQVVAPKSAWQDTESDYSDGNVSPQWILI